MRNPYLAKRHWEFEEAALSKTNEMVKRYDDVIDLSIGDPDYPADRRILDAMYEQGTPSSWETRTLEERL